MKRFNRFLIFLILMGSVSAPAQNHQPETEQQAINKRAVSLTMKHYYKESLALLDSLELTLTPGKQLMLKSSILNNKGLNYHYLGEYSKAIYWYEKALEISRNIKDPDLQTQLLNIGIVYRQMGINEKAIEYLYEAIEYAVRNSDKVTQASAYNALGNLYKAERDIKKAMYYSWLALEIKKQLGDWDMVAGSYNNIGSTYILLGKYDSAQVYLDSALQLKKKFSSQSSIANTLSNLGEVYMLQGKHVEALKQFSSSYAIRRLLNNQTDLARSLSELGEISFRSGRLSDAKMYLTKCLAISEKIPLNDLSEKSHNFLKRVYQSEGNYSKALYHAEQYIALFARSASLDSQSSQKQKDARYELILKKKEIDDLNEENVKRKIELERQTLQNQISQNRIFILILIVLLFGLLSFFLYSLFRGKARFSKKLDLLMRDLHHRVKNNFQLLHAITGLQINHIDDPKAKAILEENNQRLSAMILLHQDIYLHKDITGVNISDYVRKLLQSLRALNNAVEIDVQLQLDEGFVMASDRAIIIALIINEMLTNAFKHAFDPGHPDPEIKLVLQRSEDKRSILLYSDNGKGISEEVSNHSLGLKLIQSQVKQLKGRFSLQPHPGLTIKIEF